MANKKGMRVKDVGATINLGNYSSLHITIGEEEEFAGLDLGKAENYLRNIAKSVDGVLNLPERAEPPKAPTPPPKLAGERLFTFKVGDSIFYDHESHTYTNEKGDRLTSVTQLLKTYYPFTADGKINQAYMDFAASYGNLVHTAIQNSVMGRAPKKELVNHIITDVLYAMGDYHNPSVESVLYSPDYLIAGRFDIVTENEDGTYTLWDVKTNTDVFAKNECELPEKIREAYDKIVKTDTIFGEHTLQLNIYAYMLEHYCNCKVSAIKIIWVPDQFNAIIDVQKLKVKPLLDDYAKRNRK